MVPNSSSKSSAKALQTAERRAKIWELRLSGRSLASIGKELGISDVAVYTHLKHTLVHINSKTLETAEKVRLLELQRLDELQEGIYPAAKTGNMLAIDRILKIQERRARLLGLDAPGKLSLTDPSGDEPYDPRKLLGKLLPELATGGAAEATQEVKQG